METMVTTVSKGGRMVIPAEYRKQLGINEGDALTLTLDEYGIRISNGRLALRRLQQLAKKRIAKGRSLSKELIAERRAEAKKESNL